MKTVSISKLSIVFALTLGLLAAWSSTVPANITGVDNTIGGGCDKCTGTDPDGACPEGCSGSLIVCTWGSDGSPRCNYGLVKPCSGKSESCKTPKNALGCAY
jgi:hypothetical protein